MAQHNRPADTTLTVLPDLTTLTREASGEILAKLQNIAAKNDLLGQWNDYHEDLSSDRGSVLENPGGVLIQSAETTDAVAVEDIPASYAGDLPDITENTILYSYSREGVPVSTTSRGADLDPNENMARSVSGNIVLAIRGLGVGAITNLHVPGQPLLSITPTEILLASGDGNITLPNTTLDGVERVLILGVDIVRFYGGSITYTTTYTYVPLSEMPDTATEMRALLHGDAAQSPPPLVSPGSPSAPFISLDSSTSITGGVHYFSIGHAEEVPRIAFRQI